MRSRCRRYGVVDSRTRERPGQPCLHMAPAIGGRTVRASRESSLSSIAARLVRRRLHSDSGHQGWLARHDSQPECFRRRCRGRCGRIAGERNRAVCVEALLSACLSVGACHLADVGRLVRVVSERNGSCLQCTVAVKGSCDGIGMEIAGRRSACDG